MARNVKNGIRITVKDSLSRKVSQIKFGLVLCVKKYLRILLQMTRSNARFVKNGSTKSALNILDLMYLNGIFVFRK